MEFDPVDAVMQVSSTISTLSRTVEKSGVPEFAKLPSELQLKIWSYVAGEPQTITVTSQLVTSTHGNGRSIPGYFHACLDSREAALQRHTSRFGSNLGRPVYFDPDKDVLELNDDGDQYQLDPIYLFCNRGGLTYETLMNWDNRTEDLPCVKRLSIRIQNLFDVERLVQLCSTFENLKELRIREVWGPLSEASQPVSGESWEDTITKVDRDWLPSTSLGISPAEVEKQWHEFRDLPDLWVVLSSRSDTWKPPKIFLDQTLEAPS